MTLLFFADGETFASGAVGYTYAPVTEGETTNQIVMPIEVEGIPTLAVLDTGAPYVICAPKVAAEAGVHPEAALERKIMLIRGMRLSGFVVRLNIRLVARAGDNLDVDATVFVPDSEYLWGDFPSFIGLGGFLERIRFALDPNTDTFYFGQL
ncbi:aspartyl protease family protein [[Phormidium] sp. ETS-05]|uniref:aspartyl protease family protein n=1 Tax=[Phormidium] sp. ETS-05 TaxID=222819 RepID=UPI0018EF1FBB|nr:aspartyl protease family protein [[Phormidium] sp. ETS-05]